jgi:hypothetical protein
MAPRFQLAYEDKLAAVFVAHKSSSSVPNVVGDAAK